jgi:predicted DNA-binding ribbon-helix-helix protein
MARRKIDRHALSIRLPMDLYDKIEEMTEERGIELTQMIYPLALI